MGTFQGTRSRLLTRGLGGSGSGGGGTLHLGCVYRGDLGDLGERCEVGIMTL